MDIFNSFADKILPENCKKSLATVQEKFKPEQYKKCLSSITFQNKVALRRSLKSPHMTLGECIDCEKDLDPLPTNYTGPTLEPGDNISVDFVRQLRYLGDNSINLIIKSILDVRTSRDCFCCGQQH